MKTVKVCVAAAAIAALLAPMAFGEDRGKKLFNDPKLAGAAAGKSCRSCHDDDSGLEKSATKNEFNTAGKKTARLEDAVNACIERRMKGRALAPGSPDLADLVTYIRSFKRAAPLLPSKKKTADTAC